VYYPAGWRAISSAAGAPPSVIFVAPGEVALIIVGAAPLDVPSLAGADHLIESSIAQDGLTLVAALRAPSGELATYSAVFNHVLESIVPTPVEPGRAGDALSRPRNSPAR
jgi:hypothetical protein